METTHRAIVCENWCAPDQLQLRELPSAGQPGKGRVTIAVEAAACNFPDVLMIAGKYQYKPKLPFSPGSEIAGIVRAVGAGVTHLKPGDRVMAQLGHGAFSEEVVVKAGVGVVKLSDGNVGAGAGAGAGAGGNAMSSEVAASFWMTYGTSCNALLDRGHVTKGETLLVLGAAGGVGLAAVEIGKALGANVVAAASTDAKLAACRAHGADATINYGDMLGPAGEVDGRALRKAIRDACPHGLDVCFDPLGGGFSEPCIRSMARGGRHLVVGFAAGRIPNVALNLALLKECQICGVNWGQRNRVDRAAMQRELRTLMQWHAEGKLRPEVSSAYPLERAADALMELAQRRAVGKVVLLTRLHPSRSSGSVDTGTGAAKAKL